jgi:hypothetical protein
MAIVLAAYDSTLGDPRKLLWVSTDPDLIEVVADRLHELTTSPTPRRRNHLRVVEAGGRKSAR